MIENPHLWWGFFIAQYIYSKLKNNMKKVIRMTEADLTKLVRRVISEQGAIIPGEEKDLRMKLQKLVGTGSGHEFKTICRMCSEYRLDKNNPRAERAANEFDSAITGGENPFSNIAGDNKKSSAYKAGMAISKNLKSAVDICTMIQNYKFYTNQSESFCDAVQGELNYKVDSTSNLNLMVGIPIYNIVNKSETVGMNSQIKMD